VHTGMGTQPELVPVLLARLRFVRDLRRVIEDELDREEHAVVAVLRDAGVPWHSSWTRSTAPRSRPSASATPGQGRG